MLRLYCDNNEVRQLNGIFYREPLEGFTKVKAGIEIRDYQLRFIPASTSAGIAAPQLGRAGFKPTSPTPALGVPVQVINREPILNFYMRTFGRYCNASAKWMD